MEKLVSIFTPDNIDLTLKYKFIDKHPSTIILKEIFMNLEIIKNNMEKYKSIFSNSNLTDAQKEEFVMTIAVFLHRIIDKNFNSECENSECEKNFESSCTIPADRTKTSKRTRTSNRLKYMRIFKNNQL
jgi:hypothetical protein